MFDLLIKGWYHSFMKKTCRLCKVEKEVSEFYRDKTTKSGYCTACKNCDRLRRRGRKYKHNPERDRLRNERRKLKRKVYRTVVWGLRNGVISKKPCWCGDKEVQAHHPDYSKPLEVVWLCKLHHHHIHGQLLDIKKPQIV